MTGARSNRPPTRTLGNGPKQMEDSNATKGGRGRIAPKLDVPIAVHLVEKDLTLDCGRDTLDFGSEDGTIVAILLRQSHVWHSWQKDDW